MLENPELLLFKPELPWSELELFFLLSVWLDRFIRGLVGFARAGGILMADFRVMFLIVGINGLDKGAELVEVVQFANSCNFILDAA